MFKTNILWDNMERIAEEVHNGWWEEKKKQGFHAPIDCPHAVPLPAVGKEESEELYFEKHCPDCHTDMIPYESLPDHVKEYDRVTVRAVLNAIQKIREEG